MNTDQAAYTVEVPCRRAKPPPAGCNTWFYGDDYMRSIGWLWASRLCAPNDPPRPGYERDVRKSTKPNAMGRHDQLMVQNIGGTCMLACCTVKVQDWPEVFGVTAKG